MNSGRRPRCTGGFDTTRSNFSSSAKPVHPSESTNVAGWNEPTPEDEPSRTTDRFSRAASIATASASSNVRRADGRTKRTAAASVPDPEQKSSADNTSSRPFPPLPPPSAHVFEAVIV